MSRGIDQLLRVLIVAENVSARFGGEAFLPLHYFKFLRARGIDAWLVTHERVRSELLAIFPTERNRIYFVPDTTAHRLLWRVNSRLPYRIGHATCGMGLFILTALMQRRIVRDLVRRLEITVVHQPTPVSPRAPSAMFNVGAPVVIGPLNGGMTFPPAFRRYQPALEGPIVNTLRHTATAVNQLLPGKPRAATILVANERTRRALPGGLGRPSIVELVENGVDLDRWTPCARPPRGDGAVNFAFVGALVNWKGVNLLLEAFVEACAQADIRLDVFGDGGERSRLEAQASALGISNRVAFHGFVPQQELPDRLMTVDALVLPSLYECGGAVVLEAMALGLPVLASEWGGPADYLDPSCGVLVAPESRAKFLAGLRDGMIDLARAPERREAVGAAAREKIRKHFDWQLKIDRILEIYHEAVDRSQVGRDHLSTTLEALHADVNRVQAENARLAARLETAEHLIRELHEAYEHR
jgi:glycosyltransferase involved in cell wall biosynthesis